MQIPLVAFAAFKDIMKQGYMNLHYVRYKIEEDQRNMPVSLSLKLEFRMLSR